VDGATLYSTTYPCSMCAMILFNSGFKEIIYSEGYADDLSKDLLEEAGIEIREYVPIKHL
ncbi:MAG: hypothetical protein IJV02_03385, partial [Candidatus Methanomethylophilaceae archaeon]|nr:hypothetical protein [Candidatus Methanomethylophilaceae archaeon]